jgi:hypothetical protein
MNTSVTGDKKNRHGIDDLLTWQFGNAACYSALIVLLLIALSGLLIRGDLLRAQWGFVAFAIALLPVVAEYLTPVIFPWPMKFCITASLILHIAGGIFEFYFTCYPIYDKIGHLVASIAISLVFFVMILIVTGITGLRPGRFAVVFCIFVPVMLCGIAWEYAELNIDSVAGSTYFVGISDSLFDMLFNVIGAGYVVINVHEILKYDSPEDLYRRFIHRKN